MGKERFTKPIEQAFRSTKKTVNEKPYIIGVLGAGLSSSALGGILAEGAGAGHPLVTFSSVALGLNTLAPVGLEYLSRKKRRGEDQSEVVTVDLFDNKKA